MSSNTDQNGCYDFVVPTKAQGWASNDGKSGHQSPAVSYTVHTHAENYRDAESKPSGALSPGQIVKLDIVPASL